MPLSPVQAETAETEAANIVYHRFAGPLYTLSPLEPITITHCTSLEAQVF